MELGLFYAMTVMHLTKIHSIAKTSLRPSEPWNGVVTGSTIKICIESAFLALHVKP